MGWPRKDDQLRLYADPQEKGAYFMLLIDGGYTSAIANVYPGPDPSLVGTTIGKEYMSRTWPKRVEWSELPEDWQDAFSEYMSRGEDAPFDPAAYRGLWRVGNQPQPTTPNRIRVDVS